MRLRESSMLVLYLITGILAYAHKIPFIGRLITLASFYYGRTTIWKILVKIRKAFIIFNALIGVFMVFQTVGFSTDNLLAGFVGMGHTFIEMLINVSKRLFNWFIELFDHKIVPNVPSEPKNPKTFIPNWTPIDKDVFNPLTKDNNINLRDLYTKPSVNIDITPWYKDLSTWLWIGGVLCTISIAYTGYRFITDPTFVETIFSNNTTPTVQPDNIPDSPSPDITLSDRVTKGFGLISSGIGQAYAFTLDKLNPFNYFNTTTDINNQFRLFIEKQNDMVTADRRYYPFTENNPFLPWYKKLKLQLIGESVTESLERFKDRTIAERIYNSLQVSKGKYTDVTAATPLLTPNNWIGSVGINTPTIGSGINTPMNLIKYVKSNS